jgi:superfamily II DNA or RNA helicase
MSKINKYGYVIKIKDLSESQIKKIKKDLLIQPLKNFGNFKIKTFNIYRFNHSKTKIYLPIYYGIKNFGYPDNKNIFFDDLENFSDSLFFCNIILREGDQQKSYEIFVNNVKSNPYYGGILNLSTASGKTCIGLKIINELEMKTLIVVNNHSILNQWKENIYKFLPNTKLGIIQGKNFDIKGKNIVLGMIQTLTSKFFTSPINFGLLIVDEVHLIVGKSFSKVYFHISCPYKLGLSATTEREDGLDIVFKYFIGDIFYSNKINDKNQSNSKQKTKIIVYSYFNPNQKEIFLYDNVTPATSQMLTNISKDSKRMKCIINLIKEITQKKGCKENRKILILSDRIHLLNELKKCINFTTSGLYIGKMKKEELNESKKCQILLGTYQLCEIGFNLPDLNTLILATPRKNIEQAIGRIYRKGHHIKPIIIDIWDQFSIYKYQFYKRKKIYHDQIKKGIEFVYYNNKKLNLELNLDPLLTYPPLKDFLIKQT